MAGSTITGLGTGLNINELVSSLVTAEQTPKQNQIDRQKTTADATLSAIGTLKSALETFQASLKSLKTNSFAALGATSSKESAATVEVGSGAATGSYKLTVNQLATSSKVATQVFEDGKDSSFASGTLSISQGRSTYNVSISDGATLEDIRNSINSQLSNSAGISANIVTDSNGSRLVFSSETMGEGSDISVTGSGGAAALAVDGTVKQEGSAAGYITQAQNAQFTLDGLEMTSSTNTVTGAISGLTLKLLEEESTTISVSTNNSGLKSSVETFVTAYNTLITMANALTRVSASEDGSSTTSSILTGDASVRGIVNGLRSALVTPSSDTGGLSVLSQLGLTTARDGTLEIDDDKLTKGISEHYASIESFFTGDNGVVSRMDSVASTYAKTGGILAQREESLTSTLADLVKQQEALDKRIESFETMLYSRFNAMDSLVGQLTTTRESLVSTLESINNAYNNNKK